MAKPWACQLNVEAYPQVVGFGWYKGHCMDFLETAPLHDTHVNSFGPF